MKVIKLLIFLVSILCFLLACALPAVDFNLVYVGDNAAAYGQVVEDIWPGGVLLLSGWAAMLVTPIPGSAWLANFLYLATAILYWFKRQGLTILVGILAVILGFIGTYISMWMPLIGDEQGNTRLALDHFLVGFWLWLAAPLVLVIGTAFLKWLSKRKKAPASSKAH
jgi:hypothetical protein